MYEFERIDPRGRTPVHLGKLLPRNETQPNCLKFGSRSVWPNLTPFLAISLGLFEIVRLLLSSDANPTSKNSGGWSALHEAVSTGDPELVIEI